jgi:hypothetical protein
MPPEDSSDSLHQPHRRLRRPQSPWSLLLALLCLLGIGGAWIGIGCFLGANNFWALTPERIDYRPLISSAAEHYAWADVREIQTGCSKGKSTTYNFVVTLTDKTRIDLMEEKHQEFLAAYPQIQLALRGKNYTFSTWGLVGNCVASAPRRWLEILARRPTE